jgi:hypothetical protein
MIQNVLRAIGGVGIYDAISICLFVGVFIGAVIWATRMKKDVVATMSSLPLQDEKGNHHE